MGLKRHLVAIFAGFALAASVVPGYANQRVKISHVPAITAASLYVAIEKGYFREQNLDAELSITRGGDTVFQLAGGTIDFATGSVDTAYFNALKRGLPLMAIATLSSMGSRTTHPVVVRKDLYESGVKTAAELKGRQVAFLAKSGINEYLLDLALHSGGLSISDIKPVAPMGFGQMIEALGTKTIDAALLAEPFATIAEQKNFGVRLKSGDITGEQVLTVSTNRQFAAKHPDAVVGVLVALLKGARDLAGKGLDDPVNLKILEKYIRVPEAVLRMAVHPVIPVDGALNVDSIMKQQRFYAGRGNFTDNKLVKPETFIDASFLVRAKAALAAGK